jgi:hypothetical protein
MKRVLVFSVFPVCLAMLLASCGGGGGGTTTAVGGDNAAALTVAQQVSVVDAQSGGGGGSPSIVKNFVRALILPADSDYNTDKANVYVQEHSVEAFNTVNDILCMVAQTRYDAMLNKGPYKAQMDLNLCEGKGDASSGGQASANQSSGATMPKYAMWTVDVTRADNSSPQIVKVWAHEPADGNEPEKVIYVNTVVTEGVSASNPYGLFSINFEGHPVVGGVASPQTMFKGILKTENSSGKVLIKFFDNFSFGESSGTQAAALDRNPDGASGGGTISGQETGPMGSSSKTFDIAYNENYFHRVDTGLGSHVCLSRTEFDVSAWRYGVYDSNGTRVQRNSGFPVKISSGGQNIHGYIGYYGSWFPSEVTLSTGDTVYKETFGPQAAEEPYVVLSAGGKLRKHNRSLLTLADVAGIPLDYMEWTGNGNDNQYRVLWNGASFTKVAQMNKANWTWVNLPSPVTIDLGTLTFSELNFYSQSLNGSVQVKLQNCTPSGSPPDVRFACTADNATPVVSYSDLTVNPGDPVPTTLACFENCPDVAHLNSPNPFLPFTGYQNVAPSAAAYTSYTFDNANMVLKSGSTAVVAASVDNGVQWGINSGPLFEPNPTNLATLQCPWDNNTCPWQAHSNLLVYYTWETGPNSWNRLVALKNPVTDAFVTFDPPLVLQYTHTGNGYTNAKFSLQYEGFGNLHGIPGKCVNIETNLDADCSQGGPGVPIRWVPEFTIADGSALVSGSATYYVKALEKEQRMKKAPGACTGLPVTSYASQLPGLADWTAPNIGTEPTVTGAPAVIGGVLQ